MKNYIISLSAIDNTVLVSQMSVIENKLDNLNYNFAEKTVFCDCCEDVGNDFAEYFFLRFNELNLKKLIAVCYLPVDDSERLHPHLIEVNEMPDLSCCAGMSGLQRVIRICDELKKNSVNAVELKDSEYVHIFSNADENVKRLDGSIDFRSAEFKSLLEQSDIFFGNSPILLYDEYMSMASKKKSLIFSLINQDLKNWRKEDVGFLYWSKIDPDFDCEEVLTDINGDKWMYTGKPCIYTNF